MAGANGKYSEELVHALEEAIESGMSNIRACDLVGITENTFYTWIKEKDEFSKRIKEARSRKIKNCLDRIRKAGDRTWQADAWILERTEFKDFGKQEKIEHSGEQTIRVTIEEDDTPEAE